MSAQIFESELARCGKVFADADGKEYVYLYVASACTAKTPYAWYTADDSDRALQSAMPGASAICKVVVATETLTSAAYSKFQIGGLCEDMITPSITGVTGQTLKIASAVVAAGGAATLTPDDFGIVKLGATAAVFDVYLLNREITPS